MNLLEFLQTVDFSAYWNYNGSLTMPPCQEGIKWTVLNDVQKLGMKQLERIRSNVPNGRNNRIV